MDMRQDFSRVAILGDGPDAIRVVHAIRELAYEQRATLRTIALHGDRDHRAFHVREADETVRISSARADQLGALRDGLIRARADALWSAASGIPHAALIALCRELDIAFIAASPALVGQLADPAALHRMACDAGWPGELRPGPRRRVAILVVADREGRVRGPAISDISVARGGEPVLVECPAPALGSDTERALHDAAVRLAGKLRFVGVATVEAVVAIDTGRFAFAALRPGATDQHAVEATTGLDLVKLQLQLARGGVLERGLPAPRGHAFAVRLTREDPEHGFELTAGVIELYRPPVGLGLRIDPAVAEHDEVVATSERTLATLVARASQRGEALARLVRGLRDTSLAVRGGATNKACLLAMCARPEVVRHDVDDGWLDRELAAGGWSDPSQPDAALFAVAIDAYHARRAVLADRFFRTASHGRPRLGATGGHRIELRLGRAAYALVVSQLAAETYRIETGRASLVIRIAHRGQNEQRLELAGRSHRVRTIAAGARYTVEVDGVPRQITVEDALGVVRSPSPAVVLRVPVAAGEVVAAGQPVIVLEAMKMEIVVSAPVACRIRDVLVIASTQVELDAPLVVYEHVASEREPVVAGVLASEARTAGAVAQPRDRFVAAWAELRSLLFGYDADAHTARAIVDEWQAASAALAATDAELATAETEAIAMFADIQGLSRRQPSADDVGDTADDARFATAQEHLCSFLRSLDSRGDGLPAAFLALLTRTVVRYGVAGLDDSPELRDALQRIFAAHERSDEQALAIAAILDRRLALGVACDAVAGDAFHVALNQLISTSRRRFPVVHDLALAVRHAVFDEPMFERSRAAILQRARAYLDELEASPMPEVRAACTKALVSCPQPLIALLVPRLRTAGSASRAAMLEVLTRRYYRTRGVAELAVHDSADAHHVSAAYDSDGRRVTVITSYAARDALVAAVRRLVPVIRAAGDPADVAVDVYAWSTAPLPEPDDGVAEVREALAAGDLPAGLRRVVVAIAPARELALRAGAWRAGDATSAGPIRCVTFRGGPAGYVEDALYRGIHPMIARRMHVRRLAGFALERLPSVDDVILYRGVARTNRKDERLFVIAEVRDLTPVRDLAGRIVQLPYLERVLGEALAAIRAVQATRPARDRLEWNRVVLQLWEPLTLTAAELGDVVHRLAPATEGLGIEQVMVYANVPGPDGALRETVLRISDTLDGGLHLRFTEPPTAPLATLTEYERKVIALRRRGLVYPYEIVHLLTPPDTGGADGFPRGAFAEYDLDATGALAPVARPAGENAANIVVGVVRSFTAEVPEGVTRVVLLGDPSKEMGSLSEPECRRIIAALDLAERMAVPVEWFALSAGAKISRDSGTENMDWISAVLRRIIEFTQRRGEINVVVCGINVGAQPYWNAEATMLMHTRGILVMIGDSAMVLTGKQALDYSGSTSADDNQGIGGYERIMGPNGQAQYWASDIGAACRLLMRHYAHSYVVPGERFPRRTATRDPRDRDVARSPHPGGELPTIGDVFGPRNADRKRPFDIRAVMRAILDLDDEPLERWRDQRDGEIPVVWDARLGGVPACVIGIESHALPRRGFVPGDGPVQWTAGTLFPRGSKKIARAINAASGNRPVVVVANLAGFDGSPESMRELQLEYGAEIGRAVVNFDGPIVFCVVSRYHGGAFVVFSRQLNDQLEAIALEGARASVIGGAPAAAVVFARDVDARTARDPRIAALEAAVADTPAADRAAVRDQLAALRPQVRSEKLREVADEFDRIHSVQRALATGSLDRIVPLAVLRPALIDAVERGIARTLERLRAARGEPPP